MKKNKKIILLLVAGLFFIVLGFLLIFMNQNNSSNKNSNKEPKEEPLKPAFNIKIDTSKLELNGVDLSKIEFIQWDLSKEASIKSSDTSIRNKYIFNYSKDLFSTGNSDTAVSLYSPYFDLTVNIVNSNIEKYYNETLKTDFETKKEKMNQEYYSSEIIKNNDIPIMYAKTSSFQNNLYLETFYFILQESDNSSVVFTLYFKNYRVSDDNLSQFINSIRIDKNNAKYLYSTTSSDKKSLNLSLNQNCTNTNTNNVVNLELSTSLFMEEERNYNSNYITTFSIKDNKESSIVVSSNCNYNKDLLNNIGNSAKKSYSKIENYKLETKKINNKDFQILSFKYFQNNIECEKVYIVCVNKNIGYYMVEITSMDKIGEDVINSLTNIEFK